MSRISGRIDDKAPRWDELFGIAERQSGYFTAKQASSCGVSRSLLSYHAREGQSVDRVSRGIYRFRRFPRSSYEDLMVQWLRVGQPIGAVISHESAAELLDLTDIIPSSVRMIAPRGNRWARAPQGIKLHFVGAGVPKGEIKKRSGLPVTDPERTILDLLADHGQTEQTEMAISQSLSRGLTTARRLKERAERRSAADVRRLEQALAAVSP